MLFDDGTDPYWARSRVLEYLSQVQSSLPPEAKASLGPDATGVGWVFEYVLTDKSGQHSLGDLRAIQDWILKYELKPCRMFRRWPASAEWSKSIR
ncbi:Cobalt-zinc-cadmium resistance protein CzcA, Cation efflux system protein CusA [Klebsiella michiganensis]|nr:Cobalt-zinc-cadmium resistance protein CzcA, Cation efflux system protein CusA [Klebsiella michiganensis]